MRQAIIDALKADAAVTAIVGQRVYGRQGILGGLSRDKTPEAFDTDGRLMPSITVVLEAAVIRTDMGGSTLITGTQTVQIWVACGYERYTDIKAVLKAIRPILHGKRFTPVEDQIGWTDTRWASTSPELYDETLRVPTMFSRFDITYTEPI
jgi:hypothetical protein